MTLVIIIVSVGAVFIAINAVEELRDFIDHKVPIQLVGEYYIYFSGWVIKSFLPMFVLLAVLFSVSMLARKNEILAMKASGLSLYRITWPILVAAALISAGHFYYNEFIYPPWGKRKVEIKEFDIERKSRAMFGQVSNVYRQISPGRFYTIGQLNAVRGIGSDLKVYHTESNRLREIITAEQIKYHDHQWWAYDVVSRQFNEAAEQTFDELDSLALPEIKEKPEDLGVRLGKPEEMGLKELRNYIDLMKRTGGPYLREQVDLGLKFSYPLTSFIVVLVCMPFAANPRRGGIAVSFAVGAGIALAYFVAFRITQSAGYNGRVPLEVAVWGVNGVFFLIGVTAMLRAKK
jgi:LPS export ABC transporter permease LptG